MASQDIISQLRDLQMAIDDFTDLNNTTTVPSENYSNHSDLPTTTASSPSSTATQPARHYEEKSLIEEKQKSLMDSVLPFQLSAEDDFSSLLDQLNDIQLPPTVPTTSDDNHGDTIQHDHHAEKTLVSPTSPMDDVTDQIKMIDLPKATTTPPAVITTAITNSTSSQGDHGEKHWVEDDSVSNHLPRYTRPPLPNYASSSSFSSSSVSRATSTLSINSRRSTRSHKSMMGNSSNGKQRSVLGTSSSSTITNINTTKRSANKYHARTYDEMMRIPDIHERIRFYEKTYQLCIRSDSTMATWVKKSKEKGIPAPLLEGYVPPPRSRMMPSSSSYMSISRSESNHFKMSSSLSGSISMFLRKASSHHSSTPHQIPTTPAIPDSVSRSFGRQATLDKNHRLAHSMHWSTLPGTSSYSPTIPPRHQQYHRQTTHRRKASSSHLAPLPSRVTPLASPLSPKKLSSKKMQQYPQSSNKLHPSPSASISSQRSSYKKLSATTKPSSRKHAAPSVFMFQETPSPSSYRDSPMSRRFTRNGSKLGMY